MAPYQYSPLNESLQEIRVLTLHPGDFSAEIQILIHKVALVPEGPPKYEALSYVWGTTDNPSDIKVGPSGNDKIAITQNLAVALPYLRRKTEIRTLWIDALCINQQDLRERSSQVKMMGDVYQLADRVIVWLGTEKDDSTHVLKILSQLSSEVKVDYLNLLMSPASAKSSPQWSDTSKLLPYSRRELWSLDALLRRPWFSRLWVWQEIRLAKNNAVVVCGSDNIPWQSLRRAVFCMSLKQGTDNFPKIEFHRLRARLNDIANMSDSESFRGFGNTIRRSAFCGCSDPRDRIYALLSLLNKDDKGIKIQPDYTKSTGQVYQDLVFQFIEGRGTLELLRHCHLQNDRSAEMPTWVPNWDVANVVEPLLGDGKACGHSMAKVTHKGGGILSITGVMSATITKAEEFVFKDNDYMTVIDEIRRLAPPDFEDGLYDSGGSLINAIVSTFCANTFDSTTRPPTARWPPFGRSRELVLAILRDKHLTPDCPPGADERRYLDFVLTYCEGRSFLTTREGYIGLAPKAAKPGDQICVLLGCTMPLVLRPTSGLQYKVVGECHVHGLQEGEAFLGPLPDEYQPILIWDQAYYSAFIDKRTGDIQYEDPRLEDGDWDTSERAPIRLHDGLISLKVTPNILKRRGVNVQSIDLI